MQNSVPLGIGHDGDRTLHVHVDLAGECTSALTYPVGRGSKVVGPQVKMKSGLAKLWLRDRLEVQNRAAGHGRAGPGPTWKRGSATSMPRSRLQNSAKVSGWRQSMVTSAQATE